MLYCGGMSKERREQEREVLIYYGGHVTLKGTSMVELDWKRPISWHATRQEWGKITKIERLEKNTGNAEVGILLPVAHQNTTGPHPQITSPFFSYFI